MDYQKGIYCVNYLKTFKEQQNTTEFIFIDDMLENILDIHNVFSNLKIPSKCYYISDYIDNKKIYKATLVLGIMYDNLNLI